MASFKDDKGNIWDVNINVAAVKKLRSRIDFDINKMIVLTGRTPDIALATKVLEDPVLLCDILFVLCEKQAEQRGFTDEQFGELLASGDVILGAVEAFMKAVVDFFPGQKRTIFQKIMEMTFRFEKETDEILKSRFADPEANQKIKSQAEKLMRPSIGQPQSSE